MQIILIYDFVIVVTVNQQQPIMSARGFFALLIPVVAILVVLITHAQSAETTSGEVKTVSLCLTLLLIILILH